MLTEYLKKIEPSYSGYQELHVHTVGSFRDAANTVKDVFDAAEEQGRNAVAITDHGNWTRLFEALKERTKREKKILEKELSAIGADEDEIRKALKVMGNFDSVRCPNEKMAEFIEKYEPAYVNTAKKAIQYKKHRGLSDGELREMFMDIGRSKEETARSIVEKQRQEEEERHKRFRNRLFHSKSIEIDDDVDIDEETAALEREIELVRAGKIHKYLDQSPGQEEGEQAKLPETVLIEVDNSSSQHMVYADVQKEPEDSSSDSNQSKENEGVAEEPFADSEAATSQTVEDTPVCNKSICDIDVSLNVSNDMAPQGEERPSAEENHLDLRGVFDPEEEISFLFDDNPAPSDEAPAPEEAEDFELIDAAIVSDAGYFAVTYDANSNSGTFAFALETQGDRRFHESTVEECKNIEQATFEGAAALLEEIKNSGYTSIIIHMDKESCALLRRNAIYGIVDEYSESCIKYIQKAKEIVLKCHIRLTDETWTTEQIVTQSLVEGMAKKAIK